MIIEDSVYRIDCNKLITVLRDGKYTELSTLEIDKQNLKSIELDKHKLYTFKVYQRCAPAIIDIYTINSFNSSEELLDAHPCNRGDVLLISLEDTPTVINPCHCVVLVLSKEILYRKGHFRR